MANIEEAKKTLPIGYPIFLNELKTRIQKAQIKASLAVNQELICLYWEIGKEIVKRQERQGWGSGVIDRLAKDLQSSFPGIKGFSRSNIFRMKAFYLSCEKVAQAVRQFKPNFPPSVFTNIPWGHNIILIQRLETEEEKVWYAQKTIENRWSRTILEMQITSGLYQRQGNSINNFHEALPPPQSDLANQTIKDPYTFDFLTLSDQALEKEVEQGLIDHIQKLLLELGAGFAFVGRQYPLSVDGVDYFLDLLFYHFKLKCFCVIELKTVDFKPEFAGKMNFYLSAIDDLLKQPGDEPSIGMILCKNKNKITVEYALQNCRTPIGVSSYETKILGKLPDNFKGSLPTVEEIEEELDAKNQKKSVVTSDSLTGSLLTSKS